MVTFDFGKKYKSPVNDGDFNQKYNIYKLPEICLLKCGFVMRIVFAYRFEVQRRNLKIVSEKFQIMI